MNRKIVGIIVGAVILGTLGGVFYFIYDYKTTHYDVPEDYNVVIGTGTTYYINNSGGNDANTGLTPESAWKTVLKINNFDFSSGDRVLFARNEVWRERIIPQSGEKDGWMYYGDYGVGLRPRFLGSINASESSLWSSEGIDIWFLDLLIVEDVGNLIFNGETSVGIKKWTKDELDQQGDFYYDKENQRLYMNSSSNPGIYYSEIECALGQHMLYNPHQTFPHIGVHHVYNVVFANLSFRYGGAYGLKFQNVHHIHILDCEIKWMGGAEVDGQYHTRYGNGIEFFGQAFYCLAQGNEIDQMYDSGVSFQAINTPAAGIGIGFINNTISNCAYSGLELWLHASRGEITNFSFSDNKLDYIGFGWGSDSIQRKAGHNWGFAYLLDLTQSPTKNLNISYNTIQNTKTAIFALSNVFNGIEDAFIDHNHYIGTSDDIIFIQFQIISGVPTLMTQFNFTESGDYQTHTNNDIHTIFEII